jgi:hypothetical protein
MRPPERRRRGAGGAQATLKGRIGERERAVGKSFGNGPYMMS